MPEACCGGRCSRLTTWQGAGFGLSFKTKAAELRPRIWPGFSNPDSAPRREVLGWDWRFAVNWWSNTEERSGPKGELREERRLRFCCRSRKDCDETGAR